ncbi:hypothetical protein AXF42_Ash021598 [Apostasia shenzhenica]|uniref:Uncharacterized protein n=1 Tax=Apostasia shenzhenica TaxID=1088818 RepID=A0A2H9ZYN2_9ASPA|nr:hypothetical protein AXF42_Ash021598 [Apostasia shenzhenica]
MRRNSCVASGSEIVREHERLDCAHTLNKEIRRSGDERTQLSLFRKGFPQEEQLARLSPPNPKRGEKEKRPHPVPCETKPWEGEKSSGQN